MPELTCKENNKKNIMNGTAGTAGGQYSTGGGGGRAQLSAGILQIIVHTTYEDSSLDYVQ